MESQQSIIALNGFHTCVCLGRYWFSFFLAERSALYNSTTSSLVPGLLTLENSSKTIGQTDLSVIKNDHLKIIEKYNVRYFVTHDSHCPVTPCLWKVYSPALRVWVICKLCIALIPSLFPATNEFLYQIKPTVAIDAWFRWRGRPKSNGHLPHWQLGCSCLHSPCTVSFLFTKTTTNVVNKALPSSKLGG